MIDFSRTEARRDLSKESSARGLAAPLKQRILGPLERPHGGSAGEGLGDVSQFGRTDWDSASFSGRIRPFINPLAEK